MNIIKKFTAIISIFAVAAVMVTSVISVAADDEISVTLDGNKIEFDVNPQIIDGRTVVPLRKIFEEIGALVKWDGETQTVSARKSSKTITMIIGSYDMQIDNGKTDDLGNSIVETVTLDVPSQVVSGRTLVPARAISEAFGLSVEWDSSSKTVIITDTDEDDDSWKENTGTINLSDLTTDAQGVEISGNQVKITSGGDYTLTGTLSDGNITVNTEDKVKLRLSGASVTSAAGSCIYVEKADKAYITVTEGTVNSLTANDGESDALYSKENLEIKGKGTLNISAGGHAVKASDNLTIENGVLNLTSESDGIHVNDTFRMTGGTLNISAVGDGIDSESIVIVEDGDIDITTSGTPTEVQGEVEFEKSSKGISAQWMISVSGGSITVNSASHGIHCQDEIEITDGVINISSAYEKGISAHGNLTVDGSCTVINVTKSTEGMESKNIMTINNGTIDIVATDDAINATGGNSGEMMGGGHNIRNNDKIFQGAFEDNTGGFEKPSGVEKSENEQSWGKNKGGRADMAMGTEMPAMPGEDGMIMPSGRGEMLEKPDAGDIQMPENSDMANNPQGGFGVGMMGSSLKDCLIINGGNIELAAGDDCLDSNGNIVINGGVIKAVKSGGSLVGAESVIDPDGSTTIGENATIIAAVGSGNSQSRLAISSDMITYSADTAFSSGDKIKLTDKSGNTIAEYTPKASFKTVIIISPEIKDGDAYILTVANNSSEVYAAVGSDAGTGFSNQGNRVR